MINIHKKQPQGRHQLETAAALYREMAASPYPADRLLGSFFHRNRKRYGSRDRKTISEALYGIFRHKLFIEGWEQAAQSQDALFLPLAALALEGLLDQKKFAELWSGKDPVKFYNLFTRREIPGGMPFATFAEKMAFVHSFPLGLVERWLTKFGDAEGEKLLCALNERPPLVVRVNPLKISREELMNRFAAKGHEAAATALSPWGIRIQERFNIFELEEFTEGFFEVQDEGSQLVALSLDPQPGEVVWDACAGGGGKTLMLAALMKNKGRVIATDTRMSKLDDLKKRARRAGAFNIFPANLNRLNEFKLMWSGVDRLLIDAPCSGTGTLRRNPDAKWKISPERWAECRADQLRILENYTPRLKPGGRLVYATCSMEPEENEDVIAAFLEKHPEFGRETADTHLYPHETGTDGFFIATLLKRKG